MSASATRQVSLEQVRLTERNLLAFILETAGIAFLVCVPIVWGLMPWVFSFNPEPYAVTLGVASPVLFVAGLAIRPRVLRPDFVNSIMHYQEDQS